MEWKDIQANWPAMIPVVRASFPELDEARLTGLSGTPDELAEALAEASARDRQEATRDLEIWREGPMPADAYADPTPDDAALSQAGRYVPEGEDVLSDDARFGDDDQPDRPMGRRET